MRPARITAAVLASPSPVAAWHAVTLSGSVGPVAAASECSTGAVVLYSNAFGPTNDDVTSTPVYPTVKPAGAFTATTTIPRAEPAGTYPVYLRCGGATIGAGDTVTVSGSVGPDAAGSECSSVTLLSKAFVHANDFAEVPAVFAAVKPGGAFTATTTIPRAKPAGTYTITGRCGGGNLGASATLVVRAAASPTTTAAPTPPATSPSVTQPAVPAPVTGPATPATAQPASRWVIPWLAALG